MTAWATTDEVEDITGVTVDAPLLAQAQAVVELFVNRTPDVNPSLRARDLIWLNRAVAHQAAWMKSQPGYQGRSAVERVTQDGVSFDYSSKAAVNLGPLAIRAIKNLSWMSNRTVSLTGSRALPTPAFNTEPSDCLHPWQPL